MRFACDKCNAQYAIDDSKVGPKGVKVRCKRCGNIITLQPSTSTTPFDEKTIVDQKQLPPSEEPPNGAQPDQASDEIGRALDAMFGSEPPPSDYQAASEEDEDEEDLDRQATRVFDLQAMQQVQKEKEQASRKESFAKSIGDIYSAAVTEAQTSGADKAVPVPEWYLAVGGRQLGPFTFDDLRDKITSGEIDADTMVWKAGFTDWKSLEEVEELSSLLVQRKSSFEKTSGLSGFTAEKEEEDLSLGREHEEEQPEDSFSDEAEFPNQGKQINYEEAENAVLSGTGVDWVPQSLGELEKLAEQELSFLKPNEEEPAPQSLEQEKESAETAPMDDGDSSIIEKLAREQQEEAAREEERRREEQRLAEEAARREKERELAAQREAQLEREREQKEKASKPIEQVLPPPSVHAGLPRWVIGGLFGLGTILVLLLGIVAYRLFTGPAPVVPAVAVVPSATPQPTVVATSPVAAVPAMPQPVPQTVPQPVPQTPTPAQSVQPPTPAQPETPAQEVQTSQVAAVQPSTPLAANVPKEKTATPVHTRPAAPTKLGAPQKTPKEKPVANLVEEKEPPPKEPPKPPKSKGGLLDFEDEAAFEKVTGGSGAAAPVVEKPVKKELPPLSNADVLEVMKQHIEEFKACNRKQQQVNDSVKGKMVVKITIRPDGRVSQVVVETPEFRNTVVAECIVNVIKLARFPEFGGGPTTVPFPFTVK